LLGCNHNFSLKNVFTAWQKFSKGKRNKKDVIYFSRNFENNLFDLQDQLVKGKYKHHSYEKFHIYDPKHRVIHKSCIKDRIVHQLLVDLVEKNFEKFFIYDSYSCRVGKGTHAAVRRLRKFLYKASVNNTKTIYVLKCDIKKFFNSVDHEVLFNLIKRKITDSEILKLANEIINSFQTSLGKGLPLGNVTSQLFANIYLNELDYFVKNILQEKFYIRYCDDFVFLSIDKNYLEHLRFCINDFLKTKLCLKLHDEKVSIRTWESGIDFLGYVLLPKAVVLRTKTKNRLFQRVNENNLPSYMGLCDHANSYKLKKEIINKLWVEL